MHAQPQIAYIGLGGNLDNPFDAIQGAMIALRATPQIESAKLSTCYRTRPVESSGPDFCNAVAEITTRFGPEELLARLLEIEQSFGRQRASRNAPRTLDLDVIAFGDRCYSTDVITVPHPRAHQRAFVLVPLCELNPSVLLGAPPAETLQSAAHWKSSLSAAQINDVSPW
jgi:2-amino-4-hydroxy-6-hydroxymethyldihydropteridine diphosphokinase